MEWISSWLNVDFMIRFAPMYVKAAGVTITIAFWGILFSFILGFFCAVFQYYKIPIVRQIVAVYIELSRNTPLLVQLFFLYFGLPKIGVMLSAQTCAIVGLTFLGGSYMAEAFRSGLESVEKIQMESAYSLGFSSWQAMKEIIFPQAMAVSVPALCANVIFLVKETSVVSGIALADLMYVAKDLIGIYYQTDEALLMLVMAYLVLLLPILIAGTLLERKLRYAGFGH